MIDDMVSLLRIDSDITSSNYKTSGPVVEVKESSQ